MAIFSRALLLGVALVSVAACGEKASDAAPKPKGAAAAAARDWSATVVATPDGGYRMGNPNAKVKLIEYASLWCTHCRDFAIASTPVLKNQMVRSGQVSYEYRPFIIAFPDYLAFLAAKCQPAGQFFTWTDQFYRNHAAWTTPFTKLDQSQLSAIQSLPQAQQLQRLAQLSGFDQFVRLRGIPKAKLDQCLADDAAFARINAVAQAGQDQFQIASTPSFIINGEKQDDARDWPTLEAKLRAAIG